MMFYRSTVNLMFTHSANHRNFFAVIQHVWLQTLLIFKLLATFWDAHENVVVLLLYVFVIVRVLDSLVAFFAFELQSAEDIQKGSPYFDSLKRISALGTSVFFAQPSFDTAGAH